MTVRDTSGDLGWVLENLNMAPIRRKGAPLDLDPSSSSSPLDIFNSLVGPPTKKPRVSRPPPLPESGEQDDEFILAQLEKQNVRSGMAVIKELGKVNGPASKGLSGGGSFQSMGTLDSMSEVLRCADDTLLGLNPSLLRTLLMKGYKTPTPIQRLAIPPLLANPPRDLVGMARTGSGKTLAYMIPLLQRLGCLHGTAFGARALILVPTRELALQVFKVGKDLARSWNNTGAHHAGEADDGENDGPQAKSKGLRWGLIIGGESLNEQFETIANNPDVCVISLIPVDLTSSLTCCANRILATPGRLLHLIVEMDLDLRSVQFVVFDEADRLFELGFATALHEILQRLPPTRQTLLFSATLPANLVEFAKAGLQDPKLVRLDAESKLSSDLRMAFFSVKQAEKDACLLTLLRDIIRVPMRGDDRTRQDQAGRKKGKKAKEGLVQLAPHQTLIFAATKHHVEYLSNLLTIVGYAVSHIYGSLDQAARTLQMDAFREGTADVLVVTDVAARGIDIPVLENVVNYDFPHGARVFVHRVGRTARAGRQGWAWSFVTHSEIPFLLDLQLFLGRELRTTTNLSDGEVPFAEHLILGTFPRDTLDEEVERIQTLDKTHGQLPTLREVMVRGHGLYERTMSKASQPSYKRAKEMQKDGRWGLAGNAGEGLALHPAILLRRAERSEQVLQAPGLDEEAKKRQHMLQTVNLFRPQETVFEIGVKGKSPGALLMKDRRKALAQALRRTQGNGDTSGHQGRGPVASVGALAGEQSVADAVAEVSSLSDDI